MSRRIIAIRREYKFPDLPDPERVEKICCHPVDVNRCWETGRVSVYKRAPEPEIDRAELISEYPGVRIMSIRLEPVNIPAGGICGYKRESWSKDQNECCDGVDKIVWNEETNPEVVSPNTGVVLQVGGGKYPYTWFVSGRDVTFNNGKREYIGGNICSLAVGDDACGSIQVTVTDGCSYVAYDLRCTVGVWGPFSITTGCPISIPWEEASIWRTSGVWSGQISGINGKLQVVEDFLAPTFPATCNPGSIYCDTDGEREAWKTQCRDLQKMQSCFTGFTPFYTVNGDTFCPVVVQRSFAEWICP